MSSHRPEMWVCQKCRYPDTDMRAYACSRCNSVRYTQETEATGLQSGISSPASSNASVEAAQFIIDIDVQDAWNRMRRMKARVDCGSDRHLMSRETAESLGLPITPYKKGPFKPIGSGIVAVNSSINARWEAEGVPFYDKFLIPPGPDALDEYDIMIGVKRMNHLYDITFNPKNPKHLKGFLKQFKSKKEESDDRQNESRYNTNTNQQAATQGVAAINVIAGRWERTWDGRIYRQRYDSLGNFVRHEFQGPTVYDEFGRPFYYVYDDKRNQLYSERPPFQMPLSRQQ